MLYYLCLERNEKMEELLKEVEELKKEKVIVKVSEIQELIAMLSTDGQGTKQQVKEKLEGLLK